MPRLVLSLCLVASIALGAQAPPLLRLVSTPWPPFTNAAGQPRVALDLVEAALARIGVKASTTIVEPAQFTTALLGDGSFDGSGAAWKDAERERTLLFSDPYLENRLLLVARRGGDVSASSLAALKGRRIAVVEGYSYGEGFDQSGPIIVRSRSDEDSLRLLLDSKVDYALIDDLVVEHIVASYQSQVQLRLQVGTTPLVTRPLYLALRRSLPNAEAIVKEFNAQLRAMIADRTYHRLLRVDWILADVDGDGLAEYVPRSDSAGKTEPARAYTLSTEGSAQPQGSQRRFLIGGTVYDSWTMVPPQFKVESASKDLNRQPIGLFRFTW